METKDEILEIIGQCLKEQEKKLFVQYFDLKSSGQKKAANKSLEQFIYGVSQYSLEQRRKLVYKIISLSKYEVFIRRPGIKYETKEPILTLQHPLIEKLIVPILIVDINDKKLGASREMSSFTYIFEKQIKFNDVFSNTQVPEIWEMGEYFLEQELELNPTDIEAAIRLVNKKVRRLNYDIHELPEYGLMVEIEVFEKQLESLKQLLRQYEIGEELKERIRIYELVNYTWSDYLKNESKYENYQQYLEVNKIEGREKI